MVLEVCDETRDVDDGHAAAFPFGTRGVPGQGHYRATPW
jgi:hypothetical protein